MLPTLQTINEFAIGPMEIPGCSKTTLIFCLFELVYVLYVRWFLLLLLMVYYECLGYIDYDSSFQFS